MYTQYPFPIRKIDPSEVRERWAERKMEILMARLRTAGRACLQIPTEHLDDILRAFDCEWGPLITHIGYCALQGFSLPRPYWLVDSAQTIHGAASDKMRLFTMTDLNEDGAEAHDAEVLSHIPVFKHWWTSFPFKDPPAEHELHEHIEEYLSKTVAPAEPVSAEPVVDAARAHDQFFHHFDKIYSQSSLALSLSKENIRRSVHSAQLYDALRNLYSIAGPDPFDERTGTFNAPTLRKLSRLNSIDIRSVKNPEFYSNLQLFHRGGTAATFAPGDAAAAELSKISVATSGGPHWVSNPRASPTADETDLNQPIQFASGHNNPSESASGDDSDNDPDYAPSSDGVHPSAPSDDTNSDVEDTENWEEYEMDEDDAGFGPIGIPHYSTHQAEFTSSGSLGSTSASEEGSED